MAHRRKPDGRPYRRLKKHVQQTQRICWLCGGPINDELRFPHPFSRSLDHVQPVAHGGHQVDASNARAAHLRCNQKRGTGKRQRRRQSRAW